MGIMNAEENKKISAGPDIWLAGDPEDLKSMMNKGIKGIVTNTVVLKDMTDKYGSIIDLTKRYLDITDKKIAIEIDGHSTNELLDVGETFTKISDQIILKIPMTSYALDAFSELKKTNIETFCTTIFSLNQAVIAGNAGATHVLPFCEPFLEVNQDSTKLVRDIKATFDSWKNRPFITAAPFPKFFSNVKILSYKILFFFNMELVLSLEQSSTTIISKFIFSFFLLSS